MEEKEYLQTLGEQILNPHARTHVLEEIQEHIDEQMQDYIDTGMSPDAAEKEAVRQMGDPVAAGTELNRIHRPRFPGVLFGIAVALTLSGIFMQYILYGSEPLNTTYSNTVFMQHAVFYQVIGFGIILFGMFSNYMCLSKYSWFLYGLFLGFALLACFFPGTFSFWQTRTFSYYLCLLYPLSYALLLYSNRKKGWKTIVWLHVLSLLFFGAILSHTSGFVWPPVLAFVFLSVLLSGIYIQKRILPGSKKVLWCWTLLPYIGIAALAGSLFLRPQTYLYDRLLTALGLQHTDDGPGFTRLALQYEQTRFSLFGGSSVSDRLPREELYSTYLLHSIFLWFGIAAGILIIAALAFFALYSMHCALRQSNRLAMLLGTAASGVLLLELFNYVLTNFGINLFYTASVPFLSYGLTGTVANSILVGILLGIIRNRNVLYEKESGPAVIPDTGTV